MALLLPCGVSGHLRVHGSVITHDTVNSWHPPKRLHVKPRTSSPARTSWRDQAGARKYGGGDENRTHDGLLVPQLLSKQGPRLCRSPSKVVPPAGFSPS